MSHMQTELPNLASNSSCIKFCGFRFSEDVNFAAALGVNALGFNFSKVSPRYVEPETVPRLHHNLPKEIWRVGVFVESNPEEILAIAKVAELDTLQLYASQLSPEELEMLNSRYRNILCCRLRQREELSKFTQLRATYRLFDTFDEKLVGGSGKVLQNPLLDAVSQEGLWQHSFLAGGLNPENVAERVYKYHPFGVDVASGIEEFPGKKSAKKMKAFVEAVKRGVYPNAT